MNYENSCPCGRMSVCGFDCDNDEEIEDEKLTIVN